MVKEYRLGRGLYRVERTFVGTKPASELIRERVIRAGRKAIAGTAAVFPAYPAEKEKIS